MKRLQSILNSSIGNIIEWYDFGLFTIFSALFSQLFFPTQDNHTAILATFSIFAIGFFCRPICAIIFGFIGDKKGRAKSLRLSILMISLPTLLIGFLPTFASIGWLAPLLLVIIRMWQGISIGGEYSGNLIYLAEIAKPSKRGLTTAIAATGANIGILLATLIGMFCSHVFSKPLLTEWGWRIPYFLSGVFSLIIYFTRLKLDESQVFAIQFLKDW